MRLLKVLFDQGTPVPLRRFLTGHTVHTVYELGWSTLGNGELLTAAEARGFEGLVTTDQSLRHQQNLRDRRLGVVVLPTTDWAAIRRNAAAVLVALEALRPGEIREVPFEE